jgi:Fe-S oxidoreductase
MDLCLSCKACKSECPSSVDIAKLKAEFLQHYHDANGVPLRSWIIARFAESARLGSLAPWFYNCRPAATRAAPAGEPMLGFHPERTMPRLNRTPLHRWFANRTPLQAAARQGWPRPLVL